MIFDIDVLIWGLRGQSDAAKAVAQSEQRAVSIVTPMELIQGARSGTEARQAREFLDDLGFRILPLTERIGTRAVEYLESFGPSHGLQLADALIAATTAEAAEPLTTGNVKHYRMIRDISVTAFRVS